MSAKIELKFIDRLCDNDFIIVEEYTNPDNGEQSIYIEGEEAGSSFIITLDKSTAIKFAKTLRTEINKIED